MSINVDSRLKSKIEDMYEIDGAYSVKFKDMDDAFWFGSVSEVQEFMHSQARERFYEKELRKGYFDYVNENNDILRYTIEVKNGKIISYDDKVVGTV